MAAEGEQRAAYIHLEHHSDGVMRGGIVHSFTTIEAATLQAANGVNEMTNTDTNIANGGAAGVKVVACRDDVQEGWIWDAFKNEFRDTNAGTVSTVPA